jgi:phytanoyl-CoA hydroxylase
MDLNHVSVSDLKAAFEELGFTSLRQLLNAEEVQRYATLYDCFLNGSIQTGAMRSDLGAGAEPKTEGTENITQIMWPSEFVPELRETPAYTKSLQLVRGMLGDDIAFDFDMLIDKAPRSETPTPWHQDCAYWPSLPDQRAVSVWIALDDATLENGCMWFVARSHQNEMRPHRPSGKGGGALECDGSEQEATAVPLPAGGCTFHGGRTLHYSRGNSTADRHRRALIINFRPQAMIDLERAQGFDHGKSNNVRQVRNEDNR